MHKHAIALKKKDLAEVRSFEEMCKKEMKFEEMAETLKKHRDMLFEDESSNLDVISTTEDPLERFLDPRQTVDGSLLERVAAAIKANGGPSLTQEFLRVVREDATIYGSTAFQVPRWSMKM